MSALTTGSPWRSAEVRRPRLTACVLSLLAFGASIGVGQLVAGVVSPVSAPYRAVADAMVRLAPSWLVDFGKTLTLPVLGLGVGKADKFGLLVGVGAVLLAIAVVAGLISRSDQRPGRRVLIGVGLVGLVAVVTSPVFGFADVLAPLASIGAGIWTFRWLHEKALDLARTKVNGPNHWLSPPAESPTHPGKIPDSPWENPRLALGGEDVGRRELLVSGAAAGVGAAGAGVIGSLLGAGADVEESRGEEAPRLRPTRPAPAIPDGADFVADGTPGFVTSNADFYRIDTALSLPVRAAENWSMRIHGMVDRELTVRYADLLKRPLVERVVTLTCVSNEVNGSLISNARFLGVDLRELLLEAGVRQGAEQLFSTSQDGWTAGTPLDVVLEPDRGAMLALGMNGQPLPFEHGYPVRMVVPGLYGYVSATKWLADLEVTTFGAKQSYWLQRGWAMLAPIKTESRIDKPSGLDQVPAGRVTVAGIAWAQHRGIAGVDVRVDGGPWQSAQLAGYVNADTWRMWRAFVTVPPGSHIVESRATDGTGTPQTDARAEPVPNGASGYPMISFTAA
jgi:DMSO/TMAO reductase YedYZ molybdopterin-dependent catalytic subunit